MTQYAHPNGDVTDGDWVNAGGGAGALTSNVRRTTDDSTFIISTDTMSQPDTCRFRLQNGDDPYSAADHIVRYRAVAGAGFGGPVTLTVALYDTSVGSSPIASETNSSVSTSSLTDYSFTLSASEANAINDYDDLEIAFTRGAGMMGDDMKVTEAWIEYPDGGTPPAAPTAVAKNQPEAFVMFVD